MIAPAGDYPQFERLLKAEEIAVILRISRTQVYRLLATGELPGLHFGGKTVRIRAADLERFIAGQPGDVDHDCNG